MRKKIKKFVYELSQNSRYNTQELGKKLRVSQQSASYLRKNFQKKKTILDYNVVIDPSRLGFISLVVYYNFTDFVSKNIQEIVSVLRKNEYVVSIELLEQGYDLACTFCVPNLSYFNKLNKDFLQSFRNNIFVAEVYPVVVKHIYPKNYLSSRKNISEIVISGDRDMASLSEKEKRILQQLIRNPTATIVAISRILSLNPKTVIRIKNGLEQHKVIRGYSVVWNHQHLEIGRRQILINSEDLDLSEDAKLLEFAKVHSCITSLTRLIGRYDVLIEVEGENLSKKDVLRELRSEFSIRSYNALPGGNILKEKYVPEAALH